MLLLRSRFVSAKPPPANLRTALYNEWKHQSPHFVSLKEAILFAGTNATQVSTCFILVTRAQTIVTHWYFSHVNRIIVTWKTTDIQKIHLTSKPLNVTMTYAVYKFHLEMPSSHISSFQQFLVQNPHS